MNAIQKLIYRNIQKVIDEQIKKSRDYAKTCESQQERNDLYASIERLQKSFDFVGHAICNNETPEAIKSATSKYLDTDLSIEAEVVMAELASQIRWATE